MKYLVFFVCILSNMVFAQQLPLLPPPPPSLAGARDPMLGGSNGSNKVPTPSIPGVAEVTKPGWILRRADDGKWKVLFNNKWVGKGELLNNERILSIQENKIVVQSPTGKRDILIQLYAPTKNSK